MRRSPPRSWDPKLNKALGHAAAQNNCPRSWVTNCARSREMRRTPSRSRDTKQHKRSWGMKHA
eukprot:9286066-Alexandrium_andersonii.AAC.1